MKSHYLFSLALAAACFFSVPLTAIAQDPEQALLADFPPKSIDSVERANEAIKRVPEARQYLDRRFAKENADCLARFFAASCLSELHLRERKAFKTVNRVEVEAKAFLRRERADERDRAVAEREQRAAETGGKAISISGTERNRNRSEQGSGEAPPPKKRIHVERVRDPNEAASPEPADANAFNAAPATDSTEKDSTEKDNTRSSVAETGDAGVQRPDAQQRPDVQAGEAAAARLSPDQSAEPALEAPASVDQPVRDVPAATGNPAPAPQPDPDPEPRPAPEPASEVAPATSLSTPVPIQQEATADTQSEEAPAAGADVVPVSPAANTESANQ